MCIFLLWKGNEYQRSNDKVGEDAVLIHMVIISFVCVIHMKVAYAFDDFFQAIFYVHEDGCFAVIRIDVYDRHVVFVGICLNCLRSLDIFLVSAAKAKRIHFINCPENRLQKISQSDN